MAVTAKPSTIFAVSQSCRSIPSKYFCRHLKDGTRHEIHGEGSDVNLTTLPKNHRSLLFSVRGGGGEDNADSESDSEEEEEEEDLDEDDEIFADLVIENVPDEDFDEDSLVDRWIHNFKSSPPLTKAFLTAAFAASALGTVLNNGDFPRFLSLDLKKVLPGFQLWRPFTAFLNIGPLGIFWFLTAQFVWQYMSSLEVLLHKTPYDFWIMIAFGMMSMVVVYPALRLSPRFLGHNLSTYLVYIWSRYNEGKEVNLFDMVTLKAELLPWFMVGQTALLEGEMPTLDLLGIAFGFIYYYLKSTGALQAPTWLATWYTTSPSAKTIKDKYDHISSDFAGAE